MENVEGSEVLSGEGIVCLSSIDWDFIWQGHQEVMSRFAKAGNSVLFVENTGVRVPTLGDIPRMFARLRNWFKGVRGFREVEPNLIVLSPLLIPLPYSRVARMINARLMSRAINNWMNATRRASPILWTFIPTPIVHDIIDEVGPALVIYYCIDHFAASSPSARAIEASENRLFRRADLVFVTSLALKNRAEVFRRVAVLFPFGVDFEAFDRFRSVPGKEPDEFATIPHPRFGYVGGVHRWIDIDLLREAARKRPDYHFVLVGPEQTDVAALSEFPNIHLLGSRPHSALPAYIAGFDVGLIPYRLSEYTESVYPTKLNEYLAMGIPVVATALPEIVGYNDSHGGVVRIIRSPDGFLDELAASLSDPAGGRETRVGAARRNGWDRRVLEMSCEIASALHRKAAEPEVMLGLLRRLASPYRTAALVVGVALAGASGLAGWTPIVWRLGEPLRLSGPPGPADAVVVLAAGAGETGRLGQGHEERVSRAIQLYLQGYAGKIVLCSGEIGTFREVEVMRAIALTKGVKDADILMSPRGGGTQQMIMDADVLVRSQSWKRILLVSSPYHMKRAVLVWKRQDPSLLVLATPALVSRFYGYSETRKTGRNPRRATWAQVRGLAQEAAALAYYRYRGWL